MSSKEPKTWEEAAKIIANEFADLCIAKQKDYGHENILAFGELGLVVRANDKMARLKNLRTKEGVTEPKLDAWLDLAGYSILALMLDRGWFTLPLKGDE